MVSKKSVAAVLAGVLIGTVGSSPVVKAQGILPAPVPVIDLTLIGKIVQETVLLSGILDNSIKIYNNGKSQLSASQYKATPLNTRTGSAFFATSTTISC